MPVWHDITRAARESELVTIVGITQEQHPDRCRLFAQWQGFDWPILWDPFNLTGSSAVPIVLAVDESGRVRERPNPRSFEEDFLYADFGESEAPAAPEPEVNQASRGGEPGRAWALSNLLWSSGSWSQADPRQASLAHLRQRATDEPSNARAQFELGVALRLRYDQNSAGPTHRALDFQESLDAWRAALALDPEQYIWRRRIQQYGPRLDKPYPFYDWVERARSDLRARGVVPSPLLAPLTGSELAAGTNAMPTNLGEHSAPDPERKVPVDVDKLVRIETAVAAHTGKRGARVRASGAARVHLSLRPDAGRQVHWGDEAGQLLVWVATPRGWRIERNLYAVEVPEGELGSGRARALDFEIVAPDSGAGPSRLRGYALYYICVGESGQCVYYRQDFEVSVPLPTELERRGD